MTMEKNTIDVEQASRKDETCAMHKGHKGNTETLTGEFTEYAQQIQNKDSTNHTPRSSTPSVSHQDTC